MSEYKYKCDFQDTIRCINYHNGFCSKISECKHKHNLPEDNFENQTTEIINILKKNLSDIYCYNCQNATDGYCDDCHRKYMGWSISEDTCKEIAEEILKKCKI